MLYVAKTLAEARDCANSGRAGKKEGPDSHTCPFWIPQFGEKNPFCRHQEKRAAGGWECSERENPLLTPWKNSNPGFLGDDEFAFTLETNGIEGMGELLEMSRAFIKFEERRGERDYWKLFGATPEKIFIGEEKVEELFCAPVANFARAFLLYMGVQSNIALELTSKGRYHVHPELLWNGEVFHVEFSRKEDDWKKFFFEIVAGCYIGSENIRERVLNWERTRFILRAPDTSFVIETPKEAEILGKADKSGENYEECVGMFTQKMARFEGEFGKMLEQEDRGPHWYGETGGKADSILG
ncbi:Uncharacterised protein [Candidatus Gugararchaeum adminiculabundum]|nr:Uncharacterised protein [Candidatus Gugararchaeum adminiculabundum]